MSLALTKKEVLVKDVKVRSSIGFHDHEMVKIRILSILQKSGLQPLSSKEKSKGEMVYQESASLEMF